MNCQCGKPVEQAIEGKGICVDCWEKAQLSTAEIEEGKQIALARTELRGLCSICDEPRNGRYHACFKMARSQGLPIA
jgi:hypothetical protein